MSKYLVSDKVRNDWEMMFSKPSIIDYGHQSAPSRIPEQNPVAPTWQTKYDNQPLIQTAPKTSFGPWQPPTVVEDPVKPQMYNPFIEEMDISDDEKQAKNSKTINKMANKTVSNLSTRKSSGFSPLLSSRKLEIKSGAAFYKGLILYIPSFDQIVSADKNSSAIKMLFASFEFSFKIPMKIEIKQRDNQLTVTDATVIFQDQVIIKGPTWTPATHNEISVKALELLSETCYTIQAKESYFLKCKLIDAMEMKTLNLKKWELLSHKYPKLVDITKDSHIQKTLSVFLDSHTSTGLYEDIICCNLSREDVRNIKCVVDFFQLTMLPCCVTTNLSQNQGPCVVSIQKYTSAKKLLEILVESGGENDKFILHPPDTFKDFYKLHQNFWDPNLKFSIPNKVMKYKSTLVDEALQAEILKPYENSVAELFEKHKMLKAKKQNEDPKLRRAGDDFMKDTLKIDMAKSKNVAPVERMQLLLKYMEQLQEYGSRVLTSGRPEMIKIYHNAIENLRKDLDTCRKDIEKEQKDKTVEKGEKKSESRQRHVSRSPPPRRRSPIKSSRKSPVRYSRKKSVSPKRRPRSRSPKKNDRRRSVSPKRNPRSVSPRRRSRSRSGRTTRNSPPRRARSPYKRTSPVRSARASSPQYSSNLGNDTLATIFKHQFKLFVELLRRNRMEIEDTPIERRNLLNDKIYKFKEQIRQFQENVLDNERELGCFRDEIGFCLEELQVQAELTAGRPGPNDLTLPPWTNARSFEETAPPQYVAYPFQSVPGQPSIQPLTRPPQFRMPFLN